MRRRVLVRVYSRLTRRASWRFMRVWTLRYRGDVWSIYD